MGDFAAELAKRSSEGQKKLFAQYRKDFKEGWEVQKADMLKQADEGVGHIKGWFTFNQPQDYEGNTHAFVLAMAPPFVQQMHASKHIVLKYYDVGPNEYCNRKRKVKIAWEMSFAWQQCVNNTLREAWKNAPDAAEPPAKKAKTEGAVPAMPEGATVKVETTPA